MSYKDLQKSYLALAGVIQNRVKNIDENTDLGEFADQMNSDIEILLDEAVRLVLQVEENDSLE